MWLIDSLWEQDVKKFLIKKIKHALKRETFPVQIDVVQF